MFPCFFFGISYQLVQEDGTGVGYREAHITMLRPPKASTSGAETSATSASSATSANSANSATTATEAPVAAAPILGQDVVPADIYAMTCMTCITVCGC